MPYDPRGRRWFGGSEPATVGTAIT